MRELFAERRDGCGTAEYASAPAGGCAGDTSGSRRASSGDNASRCGAFVRATAVRDRRFHAGAFR